jgi:hypothetical protein
LAKSALAKAEEAAAEVAVMPAGPHAILDQIKEAVQRRATTRAIPPRPEVGCQARMAPGSLW